MLDLVNRKETRWVMLEEFDRQLVSGTLLLPTVLSEEGQEDYPSLFRDAVLNFDEDWLVEELRKSDPVRSVTSVVRLNGSVARAASPEEVEAFARGEFHRLYCLAVCRLAVESGKLVVTVYNAVPATTVATACQPFEGMQVEPQTLIEKLHHAALDDALDLPPGCPRGTLSVCLA